MAARTVTEQLLRGFRLPCIFDSMLQTSSLFPRSFHHHSFSLKIFAMTSFVKGGGALSSTVLVAICGYMACSSLMLIGNKVVRRTIVVSDLTEVL